MNLNKKHSDFVDIITDSLLICNNEEIYNKFKTNISNIKDKDGILVVRMIYDTVIRVMIRTKLNISPEHKQRLIEIGTILNSKHGESKQANSETVS